MRLVYFAQLLSILTYPCWWRVRSQPPISRVLVLRPAVRRFGLCWACTCLGQKAPKWSMVAVVVLLDDT